MTLKSINPYTGKLIKTYSEHQPEKINDKINKAHKTWLKWKQTTFNERAKLMMNLAIALKDNKTKLAKMMCAEMGKTMKAGEAEVEKCAWVCEYYAKNTEAFLKDQKVETDAQKSYITYNPLGVILAVMPWNFPYWQVFRFLAPNLMAGNCGVLKHASNVSGCALLIEKLVLQAGFPKNSFTTLLVSGKNVNQIIEHPYIKAVTLTGSTEAGKKVAEKAGSLLKKCVLELGGSDPYLILDDKNLEKTVETCVNARLINNGQSCIAAKRFIIVKNLEQKFVKLFKQKMREKKMGDPSLGETDLGPMASAELRDELHKQVQRSVKLGAKCLLGGSVPKLKGAFYPPTILTNVKKDMPAYSEELFGPVASIIVVKNTEEAIKVANDTSFGLGAAIFTKDIKKAEQLAKTEIEAGSVFVNEGVKSDPRLPFGGINESGYGRELSLYGLLEFMNIKTVYIK